MCLRLARSLEVQEAAVKKRLEIGISLVHSTIPDLFTSSDPSTVLMADAHGSMRSLLSSKSSLRASGGGGGVPETKGAQTYACFVEVLGAVSQYDYAMKIRNLSHGLRPARGDVQLQ